MSKNSALCTFSGVTDPQIGIAKWTRHHDFCIDMHWKYLLAVGETEQWLYGLDAWEESSYYTDRERAALARTEAVTNVKDGHVPDEVYERVRPFFSEKELADLTMAIAQINGLNRLSIAMRTVPGRYQPAKAHELKKPA
jgi:alkylhydroperoxidase family enzyme